MKVSTSQKGFTLIELVVVIVILGILAVTAAPKFIDLTSDAKASVVQAVEGSMNSAADMAHAKSLVNGTLNTALSIAGASINFVNGYPDSDSIALLLDIDTSSSDPVFEVSSPSGTITTINHADAVTDTQCLASYTEATGPNVKPVINSITTGC